MNAQRARTLAGVSLILALVAGLGGWTAEVVHLRGLDREIPLAPPVPPGVALGTLHVHTELSDGGGTLDDVVGAAEAAGLSFVVVTDHNRRLLPEGVRGVWRGNVLVVAGEERGTPEGHLLIIGLTHSPRGDTPLVLARQVREEGGLVVVAHPNHPRRGWKGAWPPGAATEIWSGDTDFYEEWGRGGGNLFPAMVLRLWSPDLACSVIHDRPQLDLREWDGYSSQGQVVPGLAGADSHGVKLGQWPILGYRAEMRQIINYVNLPTPLATDADTATQSLVTSLAQGSSYVLRPGRGVPPHIQFTAYHPEQGEVPMGQPALFEPGWRLRLDLGSSLANNFWVEAYRDGQPFSRSQLVGSSWEVEVDRPGAYRLEVYPPDVSPDPWLYTQPIYLVNGQNRPLPSQSPPPSPLDEEPFLEEGEWP